VHGHDECFHSIRGLPQNSLQLEPIEERDVVAWLRVYATALEISEASSPKAEGKEVYFHDQLQAENKRKRRRRALALGDLCVSGRLQSVYCDRCEACRIAWKRISEYHESTLH